MSDAVKLQQAALASAAVEAGPLKPKGVEHSLQWCPPATAGPQFIPTASMKRNPPWHKRRGQANSGATSVA